MTSGVKMVIFVLSIALGAYLINLTLKFILIPSQLSAFNEWIMVASGALLIYSAFVNIGLQKHHYRRSNRRYE